MDIDPTLEPEPELEPEPGPSTSRATAPQHPLPSTQLYSVEYPGYVKDTSTPRAIANLGGYPTLGHAFRRAMKKQECVVEVKVRPEDPFAHPIPGDIVGTSNVVLRVVKRRRKRAEREGGGLVGEYKMEALGSIRKTVRFRSMADFQYRVPDDDPITQLRRAMVDLDVEGVKSFVIPPEREDYLVESNPTAVDPVIDPQLLGDSAVPAAESQLKSNLRLFPPPLFSRQNLPLNYNYKANPASLVTTVTNEETGEERTRLINRMRWKGLAPTSILYNSPSVPEGPSKNIEETRERANQRILERLRQIFEERPVWTKLAALNQFTVNEAREIHNSKNLLPLVSYVFSDGPWRDTHVRFGYDPRQHIEARIYQRVYFRNVNNHIVRASVRETRHDRAQDRAVKNIQPVERSHSHMFDGQQLPKETASFQLCDVVDPMLKGMVDDDEDLREACHERDGWYSTTAFEHIKTVLRHKFYTLLDGYVATDAECAALLVPAEDTGRVPVPPHERKLRPGNKHNMAKGALRPEDAAAKRLRAQIERNAQAMREITEPDE